MTSSAPTWRSRIPRGRRGFLTMPSWHASPNGARAATSEDTPPPSLGLLRTPSPQGEGCGPAMSASARERANAEQRVASDPAVSAFVAASAGSGKTKLLTDRLLRLMLTGADPARIQCLPFTKAAAAEMALRLQRTLGDWVTLSDQDLDAQLAERQLVPTADLRGQ